MFQRINELHYVFQKQTRAIFGTEARRILYAYEK